MDARMTQPVGAVALAPARLDTAPVRAAVRTDLVPPQAVAAQAGAEQSRFGRKDNQSSAGTPNTSSSYDLDRETGELVYRVIDQETSDVLSQYPYQSILQLRAYLRSQNEGT